MGHIRSDLSLAHILSMALRSLDHSRIQHKAGALLNTAPDVPVKLADRKIGVSVDAGTCKLPLNFPSPHYSKKAYPVSTAPGLK